MYSEKCVKNMSLAINTTTPEGIVLATDSRQSYRNQKEFLELGLMLQQNYF
jgi:hypothetical protein